MLSILYRLKYYGIKGTLYYFATSLGQKDVHGIGTVENGK